MRRSVLGLAVLAALVPLLPSSRAVAQERRGVAPASVKATVEPSTATVGDRLRLMLRVEREEGARVDFPDVPVLIAPFEVLSGAALEPRAEGGRVVEERVYVLAAFETGALGVPQLPFRYAIASGDSGIVWTDSLPVEIESVMPDTLAEEDSGPRDIKPPVELPRRVWPFLVAAAIIVAAVAAFHHVRRWWIARARPPREKDVKPPPVPRRSAHIVAFERLRALEAEDPIARGEIDLFYVRVTEIVRLYVRDRFGVDAIDMTTSELAPAMRAARLEQRDAEWVLPFLVHADLAKFAKHRPTEDRAREDFQGAWDFVDRTRFREDAGEGGEGPA